MSIVMLIVNLLAYVALTFAWGETYRGAHQAERVARRTHTKAVVAIAMARKALQEIAVVRDLATALEQARMDEVHESRASRRVEPKAPMSHVITSHQPNPTLRVGADALTRRDMRRDIVVVVGTRRERDTWLKANPGHLGPVFTTSQTPDVLRGRSVPTRVEDVDVHLPLPARWAGPFNDYNRIVAAMKPGTPTGPPCPRCHALHLVAPCPWPER